MSPWLESIPCPSVNLKLETPSLRHQMAEEFKRRGWSLDSLKSLVMEDNTDPDNPPGPRGSGGGGDQGGGDDDDDDDDLDDDNDDDDDDDDDADDADKDKDSDKDKDKGKDADKGKDSAAKLRSEEAKKYRLRAKKERDRANDLAARLEKLENKDKPETDQLKSERDTLKTQNADLSDKLQKMAVRIAVRDEAADFNFNPKKMRSIEKLIDFDEVDVDDDGEVTGLREELERIADENPEWVLDSSDSDKDKDKDKDTSGGRRPSGKQTNGKKGGREGLDKAALERKFPALRR